MYSIVEFDEDGGVAVVPTVWIQEDKTMCWWPPTKSTGAIIAAVKKRKLPQPGKTWCPYKLRKILKSYGNYSEARKHLNKSTKRSDLTSDTDRESTKKRRKISVPAKYLASKTGSKHNDLSKSSKARRSKSVLPQPPSPPPLHNEHIEDIGGIIINPEVIATSSSVVGPSSQLNALNSPIHYTFVSAEGNENQGMQLHLDGSCSQTTGLPESSISHLETMSFQEGQCASKPILEVVMDQLSGIQESLKNLHLKMDSYGMAAVTEQYSEFEDEEFKRAETVVELEFISQIVCEQSDYKRKLIMHLSRAGGGGRTCSKFLTKMLTEIMSDQVASNYSYKGQRDKQSFEDLQLKSIFTACLKKHPLTRKTSIVFDVEMAIRD